MNLLQGNHSVGSWTILCYRSTTTTAALQDKLNPVMSFPQDALFNKRAPAALAASPLDWSYDMP